MLKRVKILLLAGLMSIFVIGCSNVETKISETVTESVSVENKDLTETGSKTETKAEGSKERYVVTFNIAQSHFTLDLKEHLKDALNDIEIQIPVDKEYFDNVEIGDVINDEFRTGSLLLKGSFGNWKVTIVNKEIIKTE